MLPVGRSILLVRRGCASDGVLELNIGAGGGVGACGGGAGCGTFRLRFACFECIESEALVVGMAPGA